jgi:hypothetical protein
MLFFTLKTCRQGDALWPMLGRDSFLIAPSCTSMNRSRRGSNGIAAPLWFIVLSQRFAENRFPLFRTLLSFVVWSQRFAENRFPLFRTLL